MTPFDAKGALMEQSLAAINIAVAQKLGGRSQRGLWIKPISESAVEMDRTGHLPHDMTKLIPLRYCEDISAAWVIVDSLPEDVAFGLVKVGSQWLCQIGAEDGEKQEAVADAVPLAICKAFLKLEDAQIFRRGNNI